MGTWQGKRDKFTEDEMPKECWPLQYELKGNRDIQPTLVELCQDLHMFVTGSCDGLDLQTKDKIVYILETAVKYWEPTSHLVFWKNYDDAILNLVKVTLEEYNNSFWKNFKP